MSSFIQPQQRRTLLLYLLVLLPFLFGIMYFIGFQQVHASVVVDTSSTSNGSSSWSHTVSSHPNSLLLVGGSGSITGVTYNGLSLTRFDYVSGTTGRVSMWYLKNPPVGTYTVTVTGGSSGGAISLYNVDQTNTFGPTGNSTDSNNNTVQGTLASYNFLGSGGYTTSGQLLVDTVNFDTQSGTRPSDLNPNGRTVAWKSNVTNNNNNVASISTATSGSAFNNWTASNVSGTYGWTSLLVGVNPAPVTPTNTPTPLATPMPTTLPTATPTTIPTPTSTPVTYTISGNVYKDFNKNGLKDSGESNYSGTPSITASQGQVTTNPDGSYIIRNLVPGLVTVTLNSLPSGYTLTSPLNGPPPSYQVTVGPGCTVNGAKGANCQ